MDLCVTPRAEHQLFQRESLSSSDLHSLWRLESGALRVDSQGEDGNSEFVRLALPGDLVGVETLAGVTDNLTVRALTPARLRPVDLVDKNHLTQILMETLSRVHQRCREVASLRTGSTTVRLQRLLRMLSGDKHTVSALPTLSDMAAIIHLKRQRAARELNKRSAAAAVVKKV